MSCGYGPLTVHASSEYRKTKARGDLFAAVGAQHNVLCKDMAHIGDNAVSDVSRARAVGCEAILFEGSQPTQREQVLFAAGTPGFLSSAIAGAARAARLEYAGSCSAGIRTASTSVAGPLLTAYVLWLLQDVIKRGGRTIYFLARDGQILHRICQRLITYLKVDVESRYLLGSRRAFFLAALPQDLEGAITGAFALAPNETVLSVLISVGFEATDCISIISEAGVSAAQRAGMISESGLGAIHARISNVPERAADLIGRIATAKAATLQYFAQEGLFASEIAYVADLGARPQARDRTPLHITFIDEPVPSCPPHHIPVVDWLTSDVHLRTNNLAYGLKLIDAVAKNLYYCEKRNGEEGARNTP